MALKLNKSFCLIIYFFSFSLLTNLLPLKAQNTNKTFLKKEVKTENFSTEERYILGPGDKLNIIFLELEKFSGDYSINSDGTISLPLIGLVNVNYLTIETLTKKLKSLYGKELIRPDLFVSIKQRRPISVSVLGEINSPGLYKLYNINKVSAPNAINPLPSAYVNLPTIVDAISKAGGITPNSNLNSVSVKRRLSGKETSYKNMDINLIDLLMKGDQSQNIILFDGDIISISRVKKKELLSKKTLQIAKGNLSPKRININVIGAVEKPGEYNVRSNTTLNKAILLANGFIPWKSSKTNIQIYRINNNGSITNKKYEFNIKEQVSNDKNPILKDGDIVKVNYTSFSKITRGIKEITSPLSNIYLLKLISD